MLRRTLFDLDLEFDVRAEQVAETTGATLRLPLMGGRRAGRIAVFVLLWRLLRVAIV